MIRLIVLSCFIMGWFQSLAQSKDILVSYDYSHPEQTMRNIEPDITNRYLLLTDGVKSKFFSPKTEYIDSIESTPEGFETFNTFKRICYEKKQQHLIPSVDGSFYVTKNLKSGSICTYDVANGTRFKWHEPLREIEWEITDITKNILGYDCIEARVEYHGRQWTAWFALEIPVSEGPWKLFGLPGLILEAVCDGGQYHFIANGIEYNENPYYEIYSEKNWDFITGTDFWKLRRECLDNPSRNFNSVSNVIVYKGIEYIKHLPRDILDYIETDY